MDKALLAEGLLILFVAFLGIYDGARLSKVTLLNPDPVGPGWYLMIVSGLLFLCGIIYSFLERKRKRSAAGPEKKASFSFSLGPAGWTTIVLVIYALLTPIAGYALATAFFFMLTLYFSGMRSWPKSIILGLLFTVIFKYLFSDLAGISLP